jgi:hypothetical protein
MPWTLELAIDSALDTELLLDLQGLEAGRFLVHVGVDQRAHAAVDGVHQVVDEVPAG